MWAVISAIAALVCFLIAFLLGISGTDLGVDLVTLGFVFVAVWMLVTSLPARSVR